jgi:hypothetical protein
LFSYIINKTQIFGGGAKATDSCPLIGHVSTHR